MKPSTQTYNGWAQVGYWLQVISLATLVALTPLKRQNHLYWLLLIVPAAGLMLWARLQMWERSFHWEATPTPGTLTRTGPYRWIRHPIHTSNCIITLSVALVHPTMIAFSILGIGCLGAAIRIYCEEQTLQSFPDFSDYKAHTKLVLPYVI